MTQRYELATTFRSTDEVHAVRLTDKGYIPIWHTDDDWLKRLRERGLLNFYKERMWVGHGITLQRVLPGDWIVWHTDSDRVERLSDETFRARYEPATDYEDA